MLSDILDNKLYKLILLMVTCERKHNSVWLKHKSEFIGLITEKLRLRGASVTGSSDQRMHSGICISASRLFSSALALNSKKFSPCGGVLRVPQGHSQVQLRCYEDSQVSVYGHPHGYDLL